MTANAQGHAGIEQPRAPAEETVWRFQQDDLTLLKTLFKKPCTHFFGGRVEFKMTFYSVLSKSESDNPLFPRILEASTSLNLCSQRQSLPWDLIGSLTHLACPRQDACTGVK